MYIYILAGWVPGPGNYSHKTSSINGKGSYFNSKLKSSLGKSFGKMVRPSIDGKNTGYPGPGNY